MAITSTAGRIARAILSINPAAKVEIRGNEIETCEIKWLEGNICGFRYINFFYKKDNMDYK